MTDLGKHWLTNGHCEKCKLHFFHHSVEPCFPGQTVPDDPEAGLDEDLLGFSPKGDDLEEDLIG